jgi:hypothetical protein
VAVAIAAPALEVVGAPAGVDRDALPERLEAGRETSVVVTAVADPLAQKTAQPAAEDAPIVADTASR